MGATAPCPNCDETDVWLEERARHIQYGSNPCDHTWKQEKATEDGTETHDERNAKPVVSVRGVRSLDDSAARRTAV
ncbi:hypothetical protein HTZ84_10560 [Haloterrigena sp. SYSU A558-1]|uniref:Uncharacterized protein n=1 Tax=Haloterrigena gelatinilytica TaxID=2741724 RepID=A0A8J8GKW5_9EURY|nr:hypothetical protein [Haloterrigena gelatinilytica]NUB91516.1 hypothetical protein [Haloterrigena gelatinilytica]NUC72745.1 hypothetical protein [Haloterrigena gelatinilytica]